LKKKKFSVAGSVFSVEEVRATPGIAGSCWQYSTLEMFSKGYLSQFENILAVEKSGDRAERFSQRALTPATKKDGSDHSERFFKAR
jgi:hypothetical protein